MMRVCLSGISALKMLRYLRSLRVDISRLKRWDIQAPEKDTHRWNIKLLREKLEQATGRQGIFSQGTIYLAVPDATYRVQAQGVCNVVHSSLPNEKSFLNVGDGIFISSPELLFVEMARTMDPVVHLLFGMELCGCFSRSPQNSKRGRVTYFLKPVTSVDKLRSFTATFNRAHGIAKARKTLDTLVDNAWSPMEALVATMALLPIEDLGYGLAPLKLNARIITEQSASSLAQAQSRVPDILFSGTQVGLNYDGTEHFGLQAIADAGVAVGMNPGDKTAFDALNTALFEAREKIVNDKQRDRDLIACNLDVLAVTYEDLSQKGGLDLVMKQVIHAIEREGSRKLDKQKLGLTNSTLAKARWKLIHSLLPSSQEIRAYQPKVQFEEVYVGPLKASEF